MSSRTCNPPGELYLTGGRERTESVNDNDLPQRSTSRTITEMDRRDAGPSRADAEQVRYRSPVGIRFLGDIQGNTDANENEEC